MRNKKEKAYEFGKYAEEMAAREYVRNGYAVLERNWRLGKTEIDLIVQKEDIVVIVEVKARGSKEEDAIEAVTLDKRRRMIKAADSYIKNLPGDMKYRFDIVACAGSRDNFKMEILEDAFLAIDLF